MNSIHTFIKKLSETQSRKKKATIIKTLSQIKDGTVTQEVLQFALNPYITFGVTVKGFPTVNPEYDHEFVTSRWKFVKEILIQLSERKLTGNTAKEVVERWMEIQSVSPILARILNKDLRAGVGVKSFNSVFPKLIPEFCVALAKPAVDKVKFPCWCEPKYDGVRTVSMIDGLGNVNLSSRNGKPYNNFPNILGAIQRLGLKNHVLDGEVKGATFDRVMNVAHRKRGKDDTGLTYVIFDIVPLNEFMAKTSSSRLIDRREVLLDKVLGNHIPKSEFLSVTPGDTVDTEEEMWEYYETKLDEGHEGAIAKDPNAFYPYKRSNAWIKLKPEFEVDAPIVGFYEGEKGKRLEGTLGGIIVDIEGVTTEVGTGFSDSLRHDIWRNRKKYLGATVEVKGQELTKDGKIRHPRFSRFREDKDE